MRRDIERTSQRIKQSHSETLRLLTGYAIEHIGNDAYALLDHANKQQEKR